MTSSNATAASNPLIPLVRVPIAELRQDPNNARSHDRRNLDAIKASLQKFGQVLPVIVRAGQIVGGNATTIAADELGWTHLDVTPADHLTPEEAVALAVALNRTAELASWDAGVLVDALQGLPTLEGTGFTAEELAELEQVLGVAGGGVGLTDPDEVPEPPVEPVTRPGDLWLLGDSRLLCGDATSPEDVARLLDGVRPDMVLTDPPYGMNLDTDFRKVNLGPEVQSANYQQPIEGDDQAFDPRPVLALLADVDEQFWWGGDWYYEHLPPRGSWIVWDKQPQDDQAGVGSHFEMLWSLQRHRRVTLRHLWTGYTAHDPGERRVHPTQKPVALLRAILDQHAPRDGLVADLYAGSGSTLIACQQAGRRAVLMEIDPPTVDLALRRYQEHTGEKPILEATGEPYDFANQDAEVEPMTYRQALAERDEMR